MFFFNFLFKECFPGNSKLYALDSVSNSITIKSMNELNIGDQVLVKPSNENNMSQFSKIIGFLHKIENISSEFVRLYYDSEKNENKYISLTPKHLIWTKKKSDEFEFIPAYKIKENDILKYYDFDSKTERLVKVKKSIKIYLENSGIYAPLTETGTLIVDNILVSCYSIIKSHDLAQKFFKCLHVIKRLIIEQFFYDNLSINNLYEDYAMFLFKIISFIRLDSFILNV
jgi:hypothetical protein